MTTDRHDHDHSSPADDVPAPLEALPPEIARIVGAERALPAAPAGLEERLWGRLQTELRAPAEPGVAASTDAAAGSATTSSLVTAAWTGLALVGAGVAAWLVWQASPSGPSDKGERAPSTQGVAAPADHADRALPTNAGSAEGASARDGGQPASAPAIDLWRELGASATASTHVALALAWPRVSDLAAAVPTPPSDAPTAPDTTATPAPAATTARPATPPARDPMRPAPRVDLDAERQLIAAAQRALRLGEPGSALKALGEHGRSFANGALTEERLSLEVRAYAASGDTARARALRDRFLARFPRSIHRPALEGLAL